ncbi:response regulator [Flammeovirgaceae bacterium SG7u.111]|nr:response regulator [Flammeovirgaceae bacterium SG7u.132]WPO33982.1 response regulator [Flammeovirgaceae bacterium SG7u.111]
MTTENPNVISILYADDDPEDRMLAKDALEESNISNIMHFVEDGEELIQYLRNEGNYEDKEKHPTPSLVLLDLNMPKKDGREALKEIKEDPALRKIPVVILTTSSAEEDVLKTYDMGVSSFITKPVTFDGLVEIMHTLGKYWSEIVELPNS